MTKQNGVHDNILDIQASEIAGQQRDLSSFPTTGVFDKYMSLVDNLRLSGHYGILQILSCLPA
jgi:hypothetical protein